MSVKFMKKIEQPFRWQLGTANVKPGIAKLGRTILLGILAGLLAFGILLTPPLGAQPPAKVTLAAIAADVAAGVHSAITIKNAVAAGMTVAQAVEAMVMAGANIGNVVYLAIEAKYSPADVSSGAASALRRLGLTEVVMLANTTLIIQAATQAGAPSAAINSGLLNAGFSANVIANATARAGTAPSPVFGYTPPGPPPPAPGVGALGVGALGGGGPLIGGGGVRPTEPASPILPK